VAGSKINGANIKNISIASALSAGAKTRGTWRGASRCARWRTSASRHQAQKHAGGEMAWRKWRLKSENRLKAIGVVSGVAENIMSARHL
jgi:hypothetical protein